MMKRINGEINIERSADAVFDFCADQRNDRATTPESTLPSTSTELIGVGSQFRAEVSTMTKVVGDHLVNVV